MRADELLATGMVERRGAGLAFVLSAVAQWFAAQALLLDEFDARRLLDAPEDLELWRYPLALAISLGSADRAGHLLAPFLAGEAGFAMGLLTRSWFLRCSRHRTSRACCLSPQAVGGANLQRRAASRSLRKSGDFRTNRTDSARRYDEAHPLRSRTKSASC